MDEAGGTGAGATTGAPFVALTFPDDAGLCVPPGAAASAAGRRPGRSQGATDSDSKAVSGSSVLLGVPVLLGDEGVCLDDGVQDEPDDDADAALLERTALPDAMELDELLDQLLCGATGARAASGRRRARCRRRA